MAEYIDREKAIKEIDKGDLLVGNNAEWAKEIVYRTPTEDVVPVVRCKDCKFWDTEKIGMVDECVCKLHSIEGIYSKYKLPNDYCSYGERKDDNG